MLDLFHFEGLILALVTTVPLAFMACLLCAGTVPRIPHEFPRLILMIIQLASNCHLLHFTGWVTEDYGS